MSTAPATRRAVVEAVRSAVAEVRGIPLEEVRPDSLLIDQVGLDSLDLLDVVFRLEREYDIEITRGEIEAAARDGMTDEEFATDGLVSDKALIRLRVLLPEAVAKIQPGLKANEIVRLFSVATFVKIVETKLP